MRVTETWRAHFSLSAAVYLDVPAGFFLLSFLLMFPERSYP